jgi:hypothetical protein
MPKTSPNRTFARLSILPASESETLTSNTHTQFGIAFFRMRFVCMQNAPFKSRRCWNCCLGFPPLKSMISTDMFSEANELVICATCSVAITMNSSHTGDCASEGAFECSICKHLFESSLFDNEVFFDDVLEHFDSKHPRCACFEFTSSEPIRAYLDLDEDDYPPPTGKGSHRLTKPQPKAATDPYGFSRISFLVGQTRTTPTA